MLRVSEHGLNVFAEITISYSLLIVFYLTFTVYFFVTKLFLSFWTDDQFLYSDSRCSGEGFID